MAVIRVELAGRAYDVRVGGGLLADLPAQCGALLRKRQVPIVSDANVVGPSGQLDADHSHSWSSVTMRMTVSPCGPAPLDTWIGASA